MITFEIVWCALRCDGKHHAKFRIAIRDLQFEDIDPMVKHLELFQRTAQSPKTKVATVYD